MQARAKTRYRQAGQNCVISRNDDKGIVVEFEQAQRAVTPGQSVVFYQGDVCLGGGVIQQNLR
jgi:tRNA-specific 2-thiouridylase